MASSRQSSQKKEREAKKKNKKKDKEERKEERKKHSTKGQGFDAMIAYVDEKGQLSSTPPDMSRRREIKLEDIQLGAKVETEGGEEDQYNTGKVTYYNDEKGYGFITDAGSGETVFFHFSALSAAVVLYDLVKFQKTRGPKGFTAIDISKQ